MGVLYIVAPLEESIAQWLTEQGVEYPPITCSSRNPTPKEVREALASLRGFQVDYTETKVGGHWQAMIESSENPGEGPWTLLEISDYQGENEPAAISFEKGWPDLILSVLQRIAKITGPFVLIPDTGEKPIVVSGESKIEDMISTWEHTADT